MTPKEILIAARAKIEAPERWIRNAIAISAHGDPVPPRSNRARCWCIEGAIRCVAPSDIQVTGAMALFATIVGDTNVPAWNDAPTRTHAEVLAAFDRAIAASGDA